MGLIAKEKSRRYYLFVYFLASAIVFCLGYMHDQDEDIGTALAMEISVAIDQKDIDSDLINEATSYLEKKMVTRKITATHLIKVERLLDRYKGMDIPESEVDAAPPSERSDLLGHDGTALKDDGETAEVLLDDMVVGAMEARLHAACSHRVTDDNQIVLSDQAGCQEEKVRQLKSIAGEEGIFFVNYRNYLQER